MIIVLRPGMCLPRNVDTTERESKYPEVRQILEFSGKRQNSGTSSYHSSKISRSPFLHDIDSRKKKRVCDVMLHLLVSAVCCIMASNKEVIDVDQPLVNYFAIGSMMNPVSLANRGIRPIHSEPAELLDHRLEFFSNMGYADAVPDDSGSSFHGVIHQVLPVDMKTLDQIEIFYRRQTATARLYDGTTRQVVVYESESREPGDLAKPDERYLDILVEGAEHFGVKQSYIEWLRQLERHPRPTTDECLAFEVGDENLEVVSVADVVKNDGLEGRPFWLAVNGKVLEANFPPELAQDLDTYKQRSRITGHQVMELHLGKVLYDPKYGVIKTMEDVTPEVSQ